MGFGEAIGSCLRKYVTFSGRARRSEYWYFYLFTILAGIPAGIVDSLISVSAGTTLQIAQSIVSLALFLPWLAVLVRRLHDTNHSGWLAGGFFLIAAVAFGAFFGALFSSGVSDAYPSLDGPAGVVAIVAGLGIAGYGIFLFVLTVMGGTSGANAYGPDPKGPDVAVFS